MLSLDTLPSYMNQKLIVHASKDRLNSDLNRIDWVVLLVKNYLSFEQTVPNHCYSTWLTGHSDTQSPSDNLYPLLHIIQVSTRPHVQLLSAHDAHVAALLAIDKPVDLGHSFGYSDSPELQKLDKSMLKLTFCLVLRS